MYYEADTQHQQPRAILGNAPEQGQASLWVNVLQDEDLNLQPCKHLAHTFCRAGNSLNSSFLECWEHIQGGQQLQGYKPSGTEHEQERFQGLVLENIVIFLEAGLSPWLRKTLVCKNYF